LQCFSKEILVPDKPEYLTIKNAAKILGVNPETLRRWDNIGKLKTKRHPINNYRIYDPVEVESLRKSILGGAQ
jgi:site-specific DNA-methyltransferase (adenine-specific)